MPVRSLQFQVYNLYPKQKVRLQTQDRKGKGQERVCAWCVWPLWHPLLGAPPSQWFLHASLTIVFSIHLKFYWRCPVILRWNVLVDFPDPGYWGVVSSTCSCCLLEMQVLRPTHSWVSVSTLLIPGDSWLHGVLRSPLISVCSWGIVDR